MTKEDRIADIAAMAKAIMQARVNWGWTFGKRARVMAIDLIMAAAALDASRQYLERHPNG